MQMLLILAPKQLTKVIAATLFIVASTWGLHGGANPLDEPHLKIIPRSAEEAARIKAVTSPATTFNAPQKYETMSAGAATAKTAPGTNAFSRPSGNILFEGELTFKVGNGLFRKLWVSAPSSTLASDGLGPLFNARSCQRCHIKDGRGHPPNGRDDNSVSMLLRVSIPDSTQTEAAITEDVFAAIPDPNYGSQIQDFGLPGISAEGRLQVDYEEFDVPLYGGEIVRLRQPTYRIANLGYGPLHSHTMLSPRVAPQMIGLGLLEAVPAADILALADPNDVNGDGISGRANLVWSHEFNQLMLGRFGLKAGIATLREQAAVAFANDIGISNPLFPDGWGECTEAQTACRRAIHGDHDIRGLEIDDEGLDLVTFYSRNLGVPARRDTASADVLHGKKLFYATGCTSCHQPTFVTHRLVDQPEQSFQLIWPYTDMLLHDMGPGLADGRPEATANGREWRTPPLWGIGLTQQVSGHTQFLHDGRARSLLEAILWHGGEAQPHRDAVANMAPVDRAALITFLESL